MEASVIIPNFQPLPLPAPLWLLQTLLIVGFFLHVIPMNMMLGSSVLSSIFLLKGRSNHSSFEYRVGKGLASALPLFVSFAITQGIVPLLFLQLLYGPAYYASSIVMAVPWISLLALLLICYYGTYLITYRLLNKQDDTTGNGARAGVIMMLVAIGFAAIGFLFSNNLTLMLTPEKWVEMYRTSAAGLNLNLGEKQLWPRYLHFMLAAIAVGGLTVGIVGLYFNKREPEYGNWLIKKGSAITAAITAIQIPVGVAFLLCLPKDILQNFMGHELIGTIALGISLVLTLVILMTSTMSAVNGSPKLFTASLIATIATILSMIVTRHMLRTYYLHPHFTPDTLPVSIQWDILIAFLICAAGLIFYLVWLSRMLWREFNSKDIKMQPTGETAV